MLAVALNSLIITAEDLDELRKHLLLGAMDLAVMALFRPASEEFTPLTGARLLAPPPEGYTHRVCIVNTALYGMTE